MTAGRLAEAVEAVLNGAIETAQLIRAGPKFVRYNYQLKRRVDEMAPLYD